MQIQSTLAAISATRVAQRSVYASHRSCHGRGPLANHTVVLVGQLS